MTLLTKNFDLLKERVEAHVAADEVIQGTYWEHGRGCFIGCTVHSKSPEEAVELFGLPVAVMRISEGVFEALPFDEAKAFFAALPDAIGQNGKDLSRVHWAFLAAELRALPQTTEDVQAAIEPVIAGMDLLASGGQWPADAARAAAHADDVDVYAADAARAAANAARAARAAARDAAYADDVDVYAAYAARAAAHAAAHADDLFQLGGGADVYAADAARAAANAARAARAAARDVAYADDVNVDVYAAYAARAAAHAAAHADDVDVDVSAAGAAGAADNAARAAAHAAAHVAAHADDVNVDVYAAYAARDAARDAARLRQRDTLLRLISDAPKGQNDE